MKTILLLSILLMLTACAPGLPELKYADGSRRIPINPHPIPRSQTVPKKEVASLASAEAVPTIAPQASYPLAPIPQAFALAAVTTPQAVAKHRCARRKESGATKGSQDSENFSKWLFPVVH
jgi:hypothetical protein